MPPLMASFKDSYSRYFPGSSSCAGQSCIYRRFIGTNKTIQIKCNDGNYIRRESKSETFGRAHQGCGAPMQCVLHFCMCFCISVYSIHVHLFTCMRTHTYMCTYKHTVLFHSLTYSLTNLLIYTLKH